MRLYRFPRFYQWFVWMCTVGMLLVGCGAPDIQPVEPQVPVQISPVLSAIPSTDALPLALETEPLDPTAIPSLTVTASATPTPAPIRFAVIGDYGQGEQAEADVAGLVKSWVPDFIITTGDNNYPSGAPETIDKNIGQFYQEYIFPYPGVYGKGADRLRFFPTSGNHDWDINHAQAYFDYFELPGNEHYYDFVWGPAHFFSLSSDSREQDGVSAGSIQALWLKDALAKSTSPWKIVYMHHPPYSSGTA